MKNNQWIITIIAVIIVGVGGFFGGMQYQKSQRSSAFAGFAGGQGGQFRRFGGANGQAGNTRPVTGQILNVDSNSITVKMPDGSSKIVLLSGTTPIMEATSASAQALTPGKNVMVLGNANSDGSITATNIQIRPAGPRGG